MKFAVQETGFGKKLEVRVLCAGSICEFANPSRTWKDEATKKNLAL
jgi:hypothetical protein